MPDDINLAIIGSGRHGRDLINYCLDIPGVRFKAVCDIWPYAQKYAAGILKKRLQPVTVYEDYREMLAREKDLDAAIIATPDSFHAEQAIACLKAKLHVYCEKEMATTIEAAREMVRASRQACRLLQIGRQHRSNPRYHTAMEYLYEKKAIGRIMSVYAQWHGHKRVPYKWPESATIPPDVLKRYGYDSMSEHRNWRWLAKFSAGEIANLASHQIDVFNWFLRATPKAVMASGGLDMYDFFELYDNATCFLEWDVEWEGKTKTVRGVHNTLTYTDSGFYEAFLGDEGVLCLSEDSTKGGFLQSWDAFIDKPLPDPTVAMPYFACIGCTIHRGSWSIRNWFERGTPVQRSGPDVRSCEGYFGVRFSDPIPSPPNDHAPHWHHLANFFNAMRGTAKLTCPAEVGFQGAVSALKAVKAMKLGRRLALTPQDFVVE